MKITGLKTPLAGKMEIGAIIENNIYLQFSVLNNRRLIIRWATFARRVSNLVAIYSDQAEYIIKPKTFISLSRLTGIKYKKIIMEIGSTIVIKNSLQF